MKSKETQKLKQHLDKLLERLDEEVEVKRPLITHKPEYQELRKKI